MFVLEFFFLGGEGIDSSFQVCWKKRLLTGHTPQTFIVAPVLYSVGKTYFCTKKENKYTFTMDDFSDATGMFLIDLSLIHI